MNKNNNQVIDMFIELTDADVAQEMDSNSKHIYPAYMSKDCAMGLVDYRERFIGKIPLTEINRAVTSFEWEVHTDKTVAIVGEGTGKAKFNKKYLDIVESLTNYSAEELTHKMFLPNISQYEDSGSKYSCLAIDLPNCDYAVVIASILI